MASRVLQTTSAAICGLFSCYSIDIEKVDSLIKEHPEYRECYFYKSLNNRGIKIDLCTAPDPTPAPAPAPAPAKLVIPEKYANHKKILIDGEKATGKNGFINALRNKESSNSDFAPMGGCKNSITSAQFYDYDSNVVLCRMPPAPQCDNIENEVITSKRYDDFDLVVFIISVSIINQQQKKLIEAAKKAGKPYLIIISSIDKYVSNYPYDHNATGLNNGQISNIVYNTFRNEMTETLEKHDLMPTNNRPLIISSLFPDQFDFKEASNLIKFKNSTDNSAD
ncbi:MAG: hypothetical protein KAG53_08140 [Endozoicomonadaceae bacterium]|nr:hypothetical protein [Endozoicomonadaceae bacterium]